MVSSRPYPQSLDKDAKLDKYKHSSLFWPLRQQRRKTFYNIDTWAQCYKTFYCCNLRIFVISQSGCPWQAFPALSNVCRKGQEPTQVKYILFVLLSGKLWPNPQIPDQAGKTFKRQHSSLLRKLVNYGRKKFYNIGPCCRYWKEVLLRYLSCRQISAPRLVQGVRVRPGAHRKVWILKEISLRHYPQTLDQAVKS